MKVGWLGKGLILFGIDQIGQALNDRRERRRAARDGQVSEAPSDLALRDEASPSAHVSTPE